ncbi:MAG: PA0069 family radical SAM protein [Acidobacteria bacterium]|nr:PA0069 family radical SAM protein [Acidobacteriota bacterium]
MSSTGSFYEGWRALASDASAVTAPLYEEWSIRGQCQTLHRCFNLPVTVDEKTTRRPARGAASNPKNRFESISVEWDPESGEPEPHPETEYLEDASRSIITRNDSPDVGFERSLNPYRGCEHGCAYCFARPTHEYLGFSAGLDFETKIIAKRNAPELLRRELAAKGWEPTPLAMSGVTDPYQPVERRLRITRGCLEVLAETRNPVIIITKNELVTRDIDLLGELAAFEAVAVCVSVTTLDRELAGKLEPRTSRPHRRIEAIRALADAGIPVGVLFAPVIPAINDFEIPKILEAVAGAGAVFASWVMLRLPWAVSPLFQDWLERHYPDRKDHVLSRLMEAREGKLYRAEFGKRMRGSGELARQTSTMFDVARRRAGLDAKGPSLSIAHFRPPEGAQKRLF